jgi:GNAT superfamily N-acetyltransferase
VFARSRRFALASLAVGLDDAEIRRWMSDDVVGRTDTWVAELDGTVVGMMVLDGGRAGGWIEHLYLDPAWIGRGLGEQFVGIARSRHPAGLQLWTFQVNEPARRFYERLGFRAVEHTDGAGNTERAPDVRYQWEPHG